MQIQPPKRDMASENKNEEAEQTQNKEQDLSPDNLIKHPLQVSPRFRSQKLKFEGKK